MSDKSKTKTAEQKSLAEEGDYLGAALNYILEKLKIVAKDGGTVNIHIDKFFSGIPPNQPPY
jgi:hypothetical protein